MQPKKSKYSIISKRDIILSLVLGFIGTLLFYIWTNFSVMSGQEEEFLNYKHFLLNRIAEQESAPELLDDFLFINVGYDIALTPVKGKFFSVGDIDITDRAKLQRFFQIVNKESPHKYIIFDVGLDRRYSTPSDSLLSLEIQNASSIAYPQLDNNFLIPDSVSQGGSAEYSSFTFSGQFSKFRLMYKNKKSIPLKMWKDLHSGTFKRIGFLYFANGKLAFNAITPRFYVPAFKTKIREDGTLNYYDLGIDILEDKTEEQLATLIKNKIVVIGDFTRNDQHSTYAGTVPGSLILLNTYLNLKNHLHFVPVSLIVILFIVFSLLIYLIVNDELHKKVSRCINRPVKKNREHKKLRILFKNILLIVWIFLKSYFLSIGIFLIILSIIIQLYYHQDINVIILTFYFSFIALIKKNIPYFLKT